MALISGQVVTNILMGNLWRSNRRRRFRRSMHKSDGYTSPTDTKCKSKTGTYLKCQLPRDWHKCWIERKSGLNVLTLHMKHGQKYRQQRIQPSGNLLLCGISIMDDGHMFDYGQLHRSAFREHSCNFRLALMYYKSFLFPRCCSYNEN